MALLDDRLDARAGLHRVQMRRESDAPRHRAGQMRDEVARIRPRFRRRSVEGDRESHLRQFFCTISCHGSLVPRRALDGHHLQKRIKHAIGVHKVPSFKIPKFFVAGMRPRKTARVRQVPGFAPPFAQAAFVPRRGKNKGQGQVPVGPAASRNNSSRNYYEARMGAATCFLRDSTPGIQLPPSQHSISKTRFTRAGSPSTMNCEPSARMSVTSSRANS